MPRLPWGKGQTVEEVKSGMHVPSGWLVLMEKCNIRSETAQKILEAVYPPSGGEVMEFVTLEWLKDKLKGENPEFRTEFLKRQCNSSILALGRLQRNLVALGKTRGVFIV